MMLRALTPEEHRDLLVSVGTHRGERRLSPIEVARLLARERAAGTPVRQLAEALGFKGASTIGSFLSLLELDGDVQGLIDWGRGTESTIPFTAAADISRLPRDEQMPAIRMTFENMLSSAEVRDLTQLRTRSGKPLVECLQQVLRRRRQVVRRHLLIGAITSDMTRDYLDRISQLERDRLFRGILESTFPDLPSLAGRLTPSRFFIVGDDTVAKTITMAGNFAEQINGALRELDVGG